MLSEKKPISKGYTARDFICIIRMNHIKYISGDRLGVPRRRGWGRGRLGLQRDDGEACGDGTVLALGCGWWLCEAPCVEKSHRGPPAPQCERRSNW